MKTTTLTNYLESCRVNNLQPSFSGLIQYAKERGEYHG